MAIWDYTGLEKKETWNYSGLQKKDALVVAPLPKYVPSEIQPSPMPQLFKEDQPDVVTTPSPVQFDPKLFASGLGKPVSFLKQVGQNFVASMKEARPRLSQYKDTPIEFMGKTALEAGKTVGESGIKIGLSGARGVAGFFLRMGDPLHYLPDEYEDDPERRQERYEVADKPTKAEIKIEQKRGEEVRQLLADGKFAQATVTNLTHAGSDLWVNLSLMKAMLGWAIAVAFLAGMMRV